MRPGKDLESPRRSQDALAGSYAGAETKPISDEAQAAPAHTLILFVTKWEQGRLF